MKKQLFQLLMIAGILSVSSCKKFLELDPLDAPTEAIYFKTPEQFKAAANDFYNKMIGFKKIDDSNIYDWMDPGSDLTAIPSSYGRGAMSASSTDIYWRNPYKYIRSNNVLIEKGEEYQGDKAGIKQYVAAAHFFRAWHYFFLLKRFGGVPIVTTVTDVNDEVLYGPRNTRYEVVDQIIRDLDIAIDGLPLEGNIAVADKGQLSLEAAKSFKARVLLYEATWEKYVGESTDWAPGQKKADNVTAYLTEAAALAESVMSSPSFQLFNGVDELSYYYLFVLEDAKSNPRGLTKAANREFILKSLYDKNLNRAAVNLSHTLGGPASPLAPNRKMMDMYLAKDGLPYRYSSFYNGYNEMTDEFENRDNRLISLVKKPGQKYWGWGAGVNGGGADYTKANYTTLANWPANIPTYYPDLSTNSTHSGYVNRKWVSENPGTETEYESYDYPQIRLAEVYLIYAEAKCELGNGNISDEDLNISINKIRTRAGVANLSASLLITANAANPGKTPLTLLGEIRRERALELYGENSRFDDLKRWGIAEQELNQDILGIPVKNPDGSPTEVATFKVSGVNIYNPAIYAYGVDVPTGALILDPAASRNFTRKHYLYPIPSAERQLNPGLDQNPEW
ncbi:RagB/SusD family nutrient uptake outer membrane protein [Desertivirga xinjiangensis]|uniref:RagB/SusD family nutrient uptake outer membrane protein n=1 Tax=Desertivirga xinjiangensis TaxID=539206 RepID=UPI00210D31EE|nr:RagB/SusD family nutrient uptake outer membrane protein [Pedobacter xinjiangensis]